MNFYLDTNIMVDLLLRRLQYFEDASKIFNFSANNKIKLYTSSHCIATLHYICKKNIEEHLLRNLIDELLNLISILPIDEDILRKSLKSQHKDFEDAIQIFCAHQINDLDGIITRNTKDFSTSEINIFTPLDAINYIKKNNKK